MGAGRFNSVYCSRARNVRNNTESERQRSEHIRWRPAYVTVTAPDQLLDAMNGMLAGAGSSALTSDPTLRVSEELDDPSAMDASEPALRRAAVHCDVNQRAATRAPVDEERRLASDTVHRGR